MLTLTSGLSAVKPEWRELPWASRVGSVSSGEERHTRDISIFSHRSEQFLVCLVVTLHMWGFCFALFGDLLVYFLLVADPILRHLNLPVHCLGSLDVSLG